MEGVAAVLLRVHLPRGKEGLLAFVMSQNVRFFISVLLLLMGVFGGTETGKGGGGILDRRRTAPCCCCRRCAATGDAVGPTRKFSSASSCSLFRRVRTLLQLGVGTAGLFVPAWMLGLARLDGTTETPSIVILLAPTTLVLRVVMLVRTASLWKLVAPRSAIPPFFART